MDLILFVVFLILSFVLIAFGLFKPEHTELSLIGFVFLFLLSTVILAENIQYKTGINETYSYLTNSSDIDFVTSYDVYSTYTLGGALSHTVGYYLAIASIIGFVGVLVGLRKQVF